MRPPPRAPMQPRDYNQFGSGPIGGPGAGAGGGAPPRPPYPPRPAAGPIPYPTHGGAGAASITTGNLLNEAFTIFFQNFTSFVVIAGIFAAPALLVSVAGAIAESRTTGEAQALVQLISSGSQLFFMILQGIATAAISYGVFQQLRGKHATVAECMSVGFSRLVPTVAVAVIAWLAWFIGLMACCVPGAYLGTLLYVAVPAVVVERPGIFGALNRSVELSEGFRWEIFGLWFAVGALHVLVGLIIGFVTVAAAAATANTSGAATGLLVTVVAMTLISGVANVVMGALKSTAAALTYYRLRAVKESIDANDLASVFD